MRVNAVRSECRFGGNDGFLELVYSSAFFRNEVMLLDYGRLRHVDSGCGDVGCNKTEFLSMVYTE